MASLLVDREAQLAELRRLFSAGGPRLALLYGRRRVGKTFLLAHAWPRVRTFYFTAADATEAVNRRQLVEDLARWLRRPLPAEDFPTWRAVFRLLLGLGAAGPRVVVLDEFQYFAEDVAGLVRVTSELNAVWEERGPRRSRRPRRPLLLVLSGSAIRTLEALDGGGAPLHGRLHWKHLLRPFDYLDAGRMARFGSLRDRALAYAIYGGTPRYLDSIDPSTSLADNVARAVLSPDGEVRVQVETALDQERGLREVAKYKAILRALAAGRTELNEIVQTSGLALDTALRAKLETLVALGYVEARRNHSARRTDPYRYRLADPAFRFHAALVQPFRTELEHNDPRRVWDLHIAKELGAYMGLVFETIVEQAYHRLARVRGLSLVRSWGRWEGLDRAGRQTEIDVVAQLTDGRIATGAIKWNVRPVLPDVHFGHVAAIERLAESGHRWAHAARDPAARLLYVAAGGFSPAFRRAVRASGRDVVLWTLKDLYRVPRRRP